MPEDNKDLKTEEQKTSDANGQAETKQDSKDKGKEDLSKLKPEELTARLQKAEEERENYKEGLLAAKTKLRTLEGGDGSDSGKTDDDSKKDDKVLKPEDREGIVAEAERRVFTKLSKGNEKTAIKSVCSQYPELLDDAVWSKVMTHYRPTRGKDTPEAIQADLEDAFILYKKDRGELDQISKKSSKEEVDKTKAKELGLNADAKRTDGGSSTTITPQQEEMSKNFRLDPKKVYKEGN